MRKFYIVSNSSYSKEESELAQLEEASTPEKVTNGGAPNNNICESTKRPYV